MIHDDAHPQELASSNPSFDANVRASGCWCVLLVPKNQPSHSTPIRVHEIRTIPFNPTKLKYKIV